MTEQQWRYHTPERDGHAPDDWVEGMEWDCGNPNEFIPQFEKPGWLKGMAYQYRDAPVNFFKLKDQCLRLPQDQREALIEAMQKPQRDWADDVWVKAFNASFDHKSYEAATAVIRSMCRPKDDDALVEVLRKVRECALVSENTFCGSPPSVSWIVSQLAKLLPEIDAALAERSKP